MATLVDYARAVPLLALHVHGFGPQPSKSPRPGATLRGLRSDGGQPVAIETAGTIGRQLISMLALIGTPVGRDRLRFETVSSDPDVIADAVERLRRAGLVEVDAGADVLRLSGGVLPFLEPGMSSLADPHAMTTDQLAHICQTIGVKAGTTKASRVAAIATHYGDEARRPLVLASLSDAARQLLDRIGAAGADTVPAEHVGLERHLLRSAAAARFVLERPTSAEVAPLRELTDHGIVGVDEWEGQLWIWKEAWPVLGRPFFTDWSAPPAPTSVAAAADAPRLPQVVGILDQAMQLWKTNPPPVLRNDDERLGKSDVKAAAKSIGVAETVVDVVSRLVIGIGLLLPNVVATRGRGRKRTVDRVWLADPSLVTAWETLPPMRRWARLLAEWCNPATDCDPQRLANRHLVLWELLHLADGAAYSDLGAFAAWFESRHAPVGVAAGAHECVGELVALGAATSDPIALTAAGRAVLSDPALLDELVGDGSSTVTVQGDMTVIAGADLHPDIAIGIDALATVESSAGAVTWRLDAGRITRAVQGGRRADELVAWLTEVSAVPLPDTVIRLVHDAAAAAGTVKLISAPTVLVVTDPADLTVALGLKSLKLTRVSETVAVTDVALPQVRAVLERKGLAPDVVVGGQPLEARSSAAEAAAAADRAAAYRASANGRTASHFTSHADHLERQARRLADTNGRLAVTGPLTLLPSVVDRLGATGR